nr:MAG TPA_asm: hypothetical protein [Caudoviricetes sp.]DAQ85019.1 MAG TPA: hypothetical protein [Caudoviricetes sp.]
MGWRSIPIKIPGKACALPGKAYRLHKPPT